MAESNITVADLTATPGPGNVALAWTFTDPNIGSLRYLRLDKVEIWAATTNDRSLAAKVGEDIVSFVHAGLATGQTKYYWIKARDRRGLYGDWYPSSSTGGVSGTEGAQGTITAGTFRTAVSGTRIEILAADNYGSAYEGSTLIARFGGVSGISNNPRFYGVHTNGFAFLGTATTGVGIVGVSVSGHGVEGQSGSDFGVAGFSESGAGVSGVTVSSSGVFGQSTSGRGVAGISTTGDGVSGFSSGGGFAFVAIGGGYGPFTGVHDGFMAKDMEAEIGDVLVDLRVLARNGVSDTVTEVALSSAPAQRTVIGVLSGRVSEFDPKNIVSFVERGRQELLTHIDGQSIVAQFDRVKINGLGEGQINVCGENGPIEAGDFLCSSSVPGKAMRQSSLNSEGYRIDDEVRPWTICKARELADLRTADDRAQIACVYLCG